ncbi:hydrolase [Rhizobium sp. P44RR-XXIV]|uniref:hydrolase n=1 Tax=Rhizobium sp. P44RR-XXIV TaxID=1921145 RepID=UPI0009847E21|nr:hydrolase [Rhizobium sp. P44RR-XXIV]TIX90878.1 hydrolase [Rhizobium sp. P44RR-XXIV]
MLRPSLDDLDNSMGEIRVISTDVFDTLLLRRGKSQRSRIAAGEAQFVHLLKQRGLIVGIDELVRCRLLAQKFAYRALNIGEGVGEVRLTDIISWQLKMLGLPDDLVDERIAIELAIEKTSLSANAALATLLRQQRQAGMQVIAVSDTALSTGQLAELINHFHGPGLIDRIYSSADAQTSKRFGGLFAAVLKAEAISASSLLHIGDDEAADFRVPDGMGIKTLHMPKSLLERYTSRVDGAKAGMFSHIRRHAERRGHLLLEPTDTVSFGREVFGPIVAEFCLYIWLYAEQAKRSSDTTVLFCARGGIGIREAFERMLRALGLPFDVRRENIMISRLVAARSAVVTGSPAVLDELGREFERGSFADVARALGGKNYELPDIWHQTFDPTRFFPLLDTDAGQSVFEDIRKQNELFARHLEEISPGTKRIVLCDTGLYGSTQRLLTVGFPDRRFETIQFARCNYKGLSEDHFPRVAGLVVEQNLYDPLKPETTVLRYWQIIESLFEPAVQSVRYFSETDDGAVMANCGDIRFGALEPSAENPLLHGALQYIDHVMSGAQVLREADHAWLRLKRAIANPGKIDIIALGVGARSVDFGRSDMVHVLNRPQAADLATKLKSVKSQLWREGAIARDFPRFKPPLLAALEMAHVLRGVSARLHR